MSQIDGEKDPRNLLQCFHVVELLVSWPRLQPHLHVLNEELFDVFSCYFPIEFANDDHPDNDVGITKSDLVKSLTRCFTSNPIFGELAIPFFLDKLSAEVIQVETNFQRVVLPAKNFFYFQCKVDTLEALKQCSPIYLYKLANDSLFVDRVKLIWNAVFSELMTGANELVVESCHSYFAALLQILFNEKEVSTESRTAVMKEVISDCKGHFRSVGTKTHRLTLHLLSKCLPSVISCSDDLSFCVDQLFEDLISKCVESSHELNKVTINELTPDWVFV